VSKKGFGHLYENTNCRASKESNLQHPHRCIGKQSRQSSPGVHEPLRTNEKTRSAPRTRNIFSHSKHGCPKIMLAIPWHGE
jgi:hypothetical protein